MVSADEKQGGFLFDNKNKERNASSSATPSAASDKPYAPLVWRQLCSLTRTLFSVFWRVWRGVGDGTECGRRFPSEALFPCRLTQAPLLAGVCHPPGASNWPAKWSLPIKEAVSCKCSTCHGDLSRQFAVFQRVTQPRSSSSVGLQTRETPTPTKRTRRPPPVNGPRAMDDDEFDDIPDEDLILALTQAGNGCDGAQSTASISIGVDSTSTSTSTSTSFSDRRTGAGFSAPPSNQRQVGRASQSLRQTTLWGGPVSSDHLSQLQTQSQTRGPSRPYRVDLPPETATHHELDRDALKTWVYPLNLGSIRDYQFSIVKNGLYHNTLVALPTGLGKTFIAATIILNFLRWTKTAKVVFVAPTKPLASQQVQACLSVAGIPRSQATLLTGETPPVLREDEWESRRLFFMTPQTLMNDLSKGYADPKSIVLLVIDEAHRATGDYAYVKVVEFMRRFSKSFRVLALTATPGASVEAVQDVIDNLGISHVEIRTEDSIDIRQYVHSRNIDTVTFDPSDEMEKVKDLFAKALKFLVEKLSSQNIYYGRDAMSLTTYGLMKARKDWFAGPGKHANQGLKFMMMAVFGILQSLAHSIKLLNFHGIKPFYSNLAEFRSNEEGKPGAGSKFRRQLLNDENFQEMMTMIEKWRKLDEFYGHPKLSYLCEVLVNHFIDAGEGSSTRAIVFSEYRDSAEEIVRLLNKQPLIKATVFVGQADSKRSEGMKQKQQIETIEKFKNGDFNVLVATSIGEEGLDIGQVDLIVCYDASSSPIRMLQRMGRTGRKRAGNIILLLMKGKEEDKFNDAKRNYQEMQALICEGSRFAFRHDLSTRIVPREIKPEVEKRHVDIPIENTQNPALPEPKRSAARLRKKPAKKKFNMPDDVETGFVKASAIGKPRKPTGKSAQSVKPRTPQKSETLVPLPALEEVVLGQQQLDELNKLYRDLPFRSTLMEEISAPSLEADPVAQRTLRRTASLKHGEYTKRCVRLFSALGGSRDSEESMAPFGEIDSLDWEMLPMPSFADDTEGEAEASNPGTTRKRRLAAEAGVDELVSDDAPRPKKRQAKTTNPRPRQTESRNPSGVQAFFMEGEDGEGSDDEDPSEVDRVPNRRGRGGRKSGSARIRKGPRGRKGLRRTGDGLEDYGDDCTRTSDVETDGSDSGGDLEGFIVDDDRITSSMQRLSTSPVTPRHVAKERRDKEKGKTLVSPALRERPFFVPVQFTQTQGSSGDDLPDILELVSKTAPAGKENRMAGGKPVDLDSDEDEDASPNPVRPSPRGRRRRVLTDSEDDE